MAKENGKGKVFQAVINMAGNIDPSLAKAVEAVEKKLGGVNLKAVAAGAAVGGIAIATGKMVIEAGKYLTKLGDTYNSAMNDMSAATGLVGEELDNLSDVMKDVYKNNFGDSMEDVAAGLADVYKVTGLVDEELQKATESGFALRDTFGYEINETARTASALMKNFGIEAEEAYNLIALGAQNGADQNGDMLDTLNEYSAQYAALGLDASQFMASLISGNEAGVFSIDKVGDAVKEFNIRSKDMSKTSAEAFESLGFNADDMFKRFSAGGDTAEAAMFEVISALQNTEDASVKNAAAVGLFGTMYEDLESNLLPVLQTMEGANLENLDVLEQINEVKYDNLGDAFEAVKRQGEVALLPLASTIAKAFTKLAPVIGDMFEKLSPIIDQTVTDIMPFVTDFLYGSIDAIQELMPYVQDLGAQLLPILGQLVANLLPPVLSLIQQLLPPLMEVVTAILPPIMSILLSVLPMITELAVMLIPTIVSLVSGLTPLIEPLLEVLAQIVNDLIMPLLPVLTQIVQAVLPPAVELLKAILGPIGDLVGWLSKVVGWVADGLTWVVDIIFGDKGDEIKAYAAGGFTDGVSIAGEAGTEAVISFDPAYRSQNLSYWAQAGRMLGADASDYNLGSYTAQTVDIGGIQFAPEININGNASKQDIIDAIEESYPEFIDLLERVLIDKGVGVYA